LGCEAANAELLDALAARLGRADVAVRHERTMLSDQRFASFTDPSGNRLEAFYVTAVADTFGPDRMIAAFRTGALGMGHVRIMVQDTSTARTAASGGWQL